ncbi:hypothetical protein [Streptomyces sp. NPDC054865]
MPSPITHTIFDTFAVAVTVTEPAEADATFGPYVSGPVAVHMYTGIPTTPTPPGFGTIPIDGGDNNIESTARCANTAGSTATTPGGSCAQNARPAPTRASLWRPVPMPQGSR